MARPFFPTPAMAEEREGPGEDPGPGDALEERATRKLLGRGPQQKEMAHSPPIKRESTDPDERRLLRRRRRSDQQSGDSDDLLSATDDESAPEEPQPDAAGKQRMELIDTIMESLCASLDTKISLQRERQARGAVLDVHLHTELRETKKSAPPSPTGARRRFKARKKATEISAAPGPAAKKSSRLGESNERSGQDNAGAGLAALAVSGPLSQYMPVRIDSPGVRSSRAPRPATKLSASMAMPSEELSAPTLPSPAPRRASQTASSAPPPAPRRLRRAQDQVSNFARRVVRASGLPAPAPAAPPPPPPAIQAQAFGATSPYYPAPGAPLPVPLAPQGRPFELPGQPMERSGALLQSYRSQPLSGQITEEYRHHPSVPPTFSVAAVGFTVGEADPFPTGSRSARAEEVEEDDDEEEKEEEEICLRDSEDLDLDMDYGFDFFETEPIGTHGSETPAEPSVGIHEGDHDGRRKKAKRVAPEDKMTGPAKRFACPYFKRNPRKYSKWTSCPGPGWEEVHRVKTHLYRRHALPLQCPRCWGVFKTDAAMRAHLQQDPPCEVRANATLLEGFTKDQEKKLRSRKKTQADMTDEDKWKEIYSILFPDDDKKSIPSPYFETRDDGDDEVPPLSEFENYASFVRREMPTLVRRELEVMFQDEFQDIEERLRPKVADIVLKLQPRLMQLYKQSSMDSGQSEASSKSPPVPGSSETSATPDTSTSNTNSESILDMPTQLADWTDWPAMWPSDPGSSTTGTDGEFNWEADFDTLLNPFPEFGAPIQFSGATGTGHVQST